MDFRRSGQLDERRRRVLMDEIAAPADSDASTSVSSGAKGPVRAYSSEVLDERQPRITELIPVRPLWVAVTLLLGLTGIATIEAIHVHAVTLPLAEAQTQLAALNAQQRGSLAAFYSAGMLSLAAVLSAVIYGIRVHRVDDYQGGYRVWLWATAALAWLAFDAATAVHDSLGTGLVLATGKSVFSGPLATTSTIAWISLYALVFGGLAVRMAWEIWPSLLGLGALATAAAFYLTGALLQLDVVAAPGWLIPHVLESTMMMLAHLAVAATLVCTARQVYLDATGRLKVQIDKDRKPKAKPRAKLKVVKADDAKSKSAETASAKQPAATTTADASRSRTGAAPAPTQAKSSVGITKASLQSPADSDDEDDYESDEENLSKSERRRLKKLARRDQQRRAA